MTFVVNKPQKFGHLFLPTNTSIYKFSFFFAAWNSNILRFKISKQKTRSETALSVVKLKNIHRNLEFQTEPARGNLLCSWRCSGGHDIIFITIQKVNTAVVYDKKKILLEEHQMQ